MPIERSVGPRDDRPRVRVGGRFAGEVPRVEFGDGGVEIVELEHDDRRDLIVGVDFDDAQDLVEELPGPAAFAARDARKDEALAHGLR